MNIILEKITKKFSNKTILSDINLEIETGKLIAILGPSGCGKTTLLRIISGLERVDSGRIFFDGKDVTKIDVKNRNIGFMFQNYALFKSMSVFENVAFGLKFSSLKRGLSKEDISKKVKRLLQFVQLDLLEKSYPNELSGGQKQRVALARSLAISPKLLLLDEPFGALDAKVRKNLRNWLKSIHRELGITTILVTHDQEEAIEMADEIVIMNYGKIEQIGNPNYLYNNPKNPFVAEFLGEVNLFENSIVQQGKIIIGNYIEKIPDNLQGKNENVIVYIRPHDLILSRDKDSYITQVKVNDILFLGALVNVIAYSQELKKNIDISLNVNEYLNNKFVSGDVLYIIPRKLIMFEVD